MTFSEEIDFFPIKS